jgi:hypothetical protein
LLVARGFIATYFDALAKPLASDHSPSGRPSARSPDKRYAVTDELATQSIYRLTATYG